MADIQKLQLELGGRNFELIEFSLTRMVRGVPVKGRYGVNVAKVREVVRMPKINPLASMVKGIAGIFELRGVPIPAVNLSVALGDADGEPSPSQQIIVTEFSQKRAGFIVDATNRIRRVSWDKVLPPSADAASCINGMTLIDENEFLFILDLERLLVTLEYAATGSTGLPLAPGGLVPESQPIPAANVAANQNGPRILLVDDSGFIRNGVKQAMLRNGYRVVEAGDGTEALRELEKSLAGEAGKRIDLVVTDVEMPRMDGLTLTRKIREHATLSAIPIVLHTSLSGNANQAAGAAVGANGYVIKNDLHTLFAMMRDILGSSEHALSA